MAAVLLLGKTRHVFEQRVMLHATFPDVAGLVQGAPVRVAGVNVGTVSRITFVAAEPRPQIRVDLQVVASGARAACAPTRWRASPRRACSATRSSR